MSSFNSSATFLNQTTKLTKSNYAQWKRSFYEILIAEGHNNVVSQPCLEFPALDATQEDKQQYDRWNHFNELARSLILTSLWDDLQHEMQDLSLASDMLISLNERFGKQNIVARQDARESLIDTRMTKEVPVRNHCQYMIACLKRIGGVGCKD